MEDLKPLNLKNRVDGYSDSSLFSDWRFWAFVTVAGYLVVQAYMNGLEVTDGGSGVESSNTSIEDVRNGTCPESPTGEHAWVLNLRFKDSEGKNGVYFNEQCLYCRAHLTGIGNLEK